MAKEVCGSTSSKYSYAQLDEINRALKVLKLNNILEDSLPFKQLYSLRGKLMSQLGLKIPRVTSLLKLVAGLSPGEIRCWHDAESGWFTEARERPGAPPVYRHVSDEVAVAVLKGEVTHELEVMLMKPDDYLGE